MHPDWLKRPAPSIKAMRSMEGMLGRLRLATVCQSAQCPNIGECFNRGTATFMILGDHCTRNCRFCAVQPATTPLTVDPKEPENLADAALQLGVDACGGDLRYAGRPG